jgi:hypothetical protein
MAEPTTSPTPAPSPGEFQLSDVLDEIEADASGAEPTEDAEAEAEAVDDEPEKAPVKLDPKGAKPKPGEKPKSKGEPDKPETPKDRDKRHTDGKLRDDLSDERPWTPDRIKAVAEDLRGLQRHAQRMWATEKSRGEKIDAKVEKFLVDVDRFRADRQHFDAQQKLIHSRLTSGKASEIIDCLHLLTGRDGAEVLEELNLELARGAGKKREPTRLEREQAQRLEALEKREEERARQAELAKQNAFVAQRKDEMAQYVLENAEDYPTLATFEDAEIGEALAIVKEERHKQKRPVTDAQAAKILEARLQEQQQKLAERAGASGLAPRAAKVAKPEQAQSSPPRRGRSLTQSATQERVSTRELEDDESSSDAADFLPANLLGAAQPNRW